jgi:putative salt-induced outer membrane protein YdiY
LLLALLAVCGLAGEAEAQTAGKTVWTPSSPPEDDFDWIQLVSGEWLKGRLLALQDEKLEFESEELDELEFDWEDVLQVRSPQLLDLLFEDKTKISGPITIAQELVAVGGAEPRTFPRAQLLGITRGGERERNFWSGGASFGLTLRSGNVDEVLYNAQAALQRRTPGTRFSLEYLGSVTNAEGTKSSDNHRLNAEYDVWLSRRLYLIVPSGEYFTDEFQNIDSRVTLGAGLGYDLVDRAELEWNVSVLPSLQSTRFDSVLAGEDDSRSEGALVLGSEFDWELSRRIDFALEYQGQYTNSEFSQTIHHTLCKLEIELTKVFELDISLVWDRVGDPEQAEDGTTPEKNDLRLILGFGFDF